MTTMSEQDGRLTQQHEKGDDGAHLYNDSRRQARELSRLAQAMAAVSGSLESDQVVQIVARQMVELLDVKTCSISKWYHDEDLLTLWGEHRSDDREADTRWGEPLKLQEYPTTACALRQSTSLQLHTDDASTDSGERAWMEKSGVKSALLLPLVCQDRTIGLVELADTNRRTFTEQETTLALLLANQAAITIENARLFQEAQHQLRVSTLLNEASRVINSSLDLNEIMQSLLSQMNELLNVEALSIALVDPKRNELVYEVGEGIGSDKIIGLRLPSNEGVSGWVMEHGQPALVPDTKQDGRFSVHGDRRTGYDTRAIICAPLQITGEVIGTIQAINPYEGTFDERDLQLLVNLANLASSAIANAKQFARIQAAEARYLNLFEDSIDPIVLTDRGGRIVEVNRPAYTFFGYGRPELLNMKIEALYPERTHADWDDRLLRSIREEQVQIFTSQVSTKSGEQIPVEVHGKRLVTRDNEVLQWIHHDISKQVELEEMREDLLAMLFHDLQSPLGNVITSLELLNYELPQDSEPTVFSIVDIAIRSSRRLQTLVRSLLDINRLEAGHPISDRRMFEVGRLIGEAREMIDPILDRRNITFLSNLPLEPLEVFVDKDMIRRVFINLFDNALKFSPDDRAVELYAAPLPGNDFIKVSIDDEGNGIPEQFRETIFDKFRRLQGKGGPKGIGLGLAFCRLAIEAHGGRIWVEDAPSGGSRFTFTLPTIDPSQAN